MTKNEKAILDKEYETVRSMLQNKSGGTENLVNSILMELKYGFVDKIYNYPCWRKMTKHVFIEISIEGEHSMRCLRFNMWTKKNNIHLGNRSLFIREHFVFDGIAEI